MNRRIIIENRSNASDKRVLKAVADVIDLGRISNNEKQYCYLTTFFDGLKISTDLNKASDRFVAWNIDD